MQETIRTNNDSEGWHNGLNRRASGRGQLPMYLLIKFLHKEATLNALQIRLSERKWNTATQVPRAAGETVRTLGPV